MTEDDLIARFFAPIAGPAALGLKDDTALYAPPAGHELVLTVDAVVAGVHFFADDPPEAIARKALRVNISDLAAKGSEPQGFLLTLALPSAYSADWLGRFASALGEDAKTYRCPLMGGDTVSTPGPLMISITVLGSVPAGAMVKRTGAEAGDILFVTGTIGDAALGLFVHGKSPPSWATQLSGPHREFLISRYLEPQPRLALAPIVRACANGAMDISDGLVGDATKMMRASGFAARVDLARVPFSDATKAVISQPEVFESAITGGDDYEILCAVPPSHAMVFEQLALKEGVAVTRIGEVIDGVAGSVTFIGVDGKPRTFARGSYSHF